MRLMGLAPGPGELRVARAERRLGTTRLVALERHPVSDAAALDDVLVRLAAARPHVVRAALPLALAAHRILVLPFTTRRRLARTAPLELLGQLPTDVEDPRVACAPLGPAPGGTAVLAAVARGADVAALGAPLARAGLVPEHVALAPLPVLALLPAELLDLALVVADGEASALVLRRAGRVAGLRALAATGGDAAGLAAEVRWSLAALGGAPTEVVVAGADATPEVCAALATATTARVRSLAEVSAVAAYGDALGATAVAAGLVLATDRAATSGPILARDGRAAGSPRRAAALAAAALVLGLVDVALVRQGLARRDAALAAAVAAEAAAALPGVPLVAPREQLEQALAAATRRDVRLGPAGGVLGLLREVSERVPAALGLDLDRLEVGPEGLVLDGRADSFESVEVLRRALAASPVLTEVQTEDTHTTVDARRVAFRLRAGRRPAGGTAS